MYCILIKQGIAGLKESVLSLLKNFLTRRGTVVLLSPESVQVVAGGSAQFNCSASTDPSLTHSLTTTWLRNEKPVGKYLPFIGEFCKR
jgi:hypothetical protein